MDGVHNGVVVLEGESSLPEGASVTVTYPAQHEHKPAAQKQRMIDPDRHVLIPNIDSAFAALDALRPTKRRHCSHCEAMRMAQSMSGEGRSACADAHGFR